MSENAGFCNRCGAQLQPNSLFCPNCGQRVSDAAPLYPETQKMPEPPAYADANRYAGPAPVEEARSPYAGGYADSYSPPAKPKRNILWIIGGLLIGLCLCGSVIIFGTFALLGGPLSSVAEILAGTPTSTATLVPTPTHTPPPATATATLLPTTLPPAAPTEAALPPAEPTRRTDIQGASDNPFFDDFSTDRGWPLVNTPEKPTFSVGWMGQYYSIVVKAASTQAWVFPPTTYTPEDLEFDAQIPASYSGQYGGTFGVLCAFIDGDNYHEIELDPFNKSYAIARIRNNDRTSLTAENWLGFDAFNQGPGAVNHIKVSCEGTTISLSINNQLALSVDDPELAVQGDANMGITVSTYSDIDPTGFEMWFDNFSAWRP